MNYFKKWCKLKRLINKDDSTVEFKIKEIWFCHLGKNIGTEQNGRGSQFLRPCLILKKFNNLSMLIVPMTSNLRDGKYYYTISLNDSFSSIILSQLKFISVKRLKYKIGQIENNEFIKIKRKIKKKIL